MIVRCQRKPIRTCSVCVVGWIILTACSAGVHADEPNTITVVSYNVQFLPPPASFANKRPNPDYRAKRIAEEISHFDIVALQEVFHPKHRSQIIAGLTKSWKTEPNSLIAPKPKGFSTNGGTALLTRQPILATNSTVYSHFSKPEEYGLRADGFAAKGVIHGRVVVDEANPSETIDVYVTHLEARADHLRPRQYEELATFIQQTSDPQRPMVLLGDMNTKGMAELRNNPESQYVSMMRALNRARPNGGVVDVWTDLRADELGGTSEQESSEIGKRIDYIFVGNPNSPAPNLVPKSIAVKTYQDEQVTALSDHNAVVAEFEWKQ